MASSRRNPDARPGAGRRRQGGAAAGPPGGAAAGSGSRLRMPPVRLAAREELAAAARVAPLLRAARDLSRWAAAARLAETGTLSAAEADAAAEALELAPREVGTAFQVAVATGMLAAGGGGQPARSGDVLAAGAEEVLAAWDSALAAVLAAENLDGLATALYTVGGPVRMDGLFDAYAAAAGTRRRPERAAAVPAETVPAETVPAGAVPAAAGAAVPAGAVAAGTAAAETGTGGLPEPDEAAAVSHALETLADLAVVELGTDETGPDEPAGGLTVALSPLGVWGVHRRLRAQGWHVPVLGAADRSRAAGLLANLASCDPEDGETEIGSWLDQRQPGAAAAELIEAAASGTPGLRAAAFAVLGRIGAAATPAVRAALASPVLRAHAAVWLREHGEEAELSPEDQNWLLVELGAGLLEEADPRDVAAELLPEMPADAQAEIVAGLWQVSHPAVTDLLTALSDHHPDPAVARAARKAAFKARSPAGTSQVS